MERFLVSYRKLLLEGKNRELDGSWTRRKSAWLALRSRRFKASVGGCEGEPEFLQV